MNVLLIGPPGSGKGTQGARLSEQLGIDHIAAGDLLRAEVAAGTELGQQASALMARGELVPDDMIIELLRPRLVTAASGAGFLLDGFPRSVGQAVEARKLAEEEGFSADVALYLDAPRAALVDRLLARAVTEGRADDTREVIANRLAVFDEATAPLVDYYRDRALLRVIDADRSEDDVTAQILEVLEQV